MQLCRKTGMQAHCHWERFPWPVPLPKGALCTSVFLGLCTIPQEHPISSGPGRRWETYMQPSRKMGMQAHCHGERVWCAELGSAAGKNRLCGEQPMRMRHTRPHASMASSWSCGPECHVR
jgi:hypothetical protein